MISALTEKGRRIMSDIMEAILKLLEKQKEAEERGESRFLCPICGGEAHWSRISGHLHCGCKGCGIRMCE